MAHPAYEDGNIFEKILNGQIPCHKIFETEHTLAILDAFPVVDGHALLLPKVRVASVLDMTADVAAAYLAELPRLARAVQRATNAPAVNIVQNSGKEAGQALSDHRAPPRRSIIPPAMRLPRPRAFSRASRWSSTATST